MLEHLASCAHYYKQSHSVIGVLLRHLVLCKCATLLPGADIARSCLRARACQILREQLGDASILLSAAVSGTTFLAY